MAVEQEQRAVPPSQGPLSTHIILSQRKSVRTATQNDVYFKCSPQKAPCPGHRQVPTSPRPITAQNGQNVDERLKAARERREQQQRILVSREQLRRERELKAKQFHEEQLQERQRRLLQQRRREETRRSAVEEKRRLQLLEEKERYESAVRKTLERSQRAKNHSLSRGRKASRSNVVNGSRLWDWQRRLVSRLLTPTCSSLNRSRSLGGQGPGEQVSYHSTSTPRPESLRTASPRVAQVKAAKVDLVHDKNRNHSFNATFLVKSSPKPSLSAERSLRKSIQRHSAPQPPELPSVPEEEVAMEAPCPGNTRPLRTIRATRTSGEGQTLKICEERPPEAPRSNLSAILETQETVCRTEGDGSPTQAPPTQAPPTQAPPTQAPPTHPSPVRQLPDIRSKSKAGTTDPEQAARVLSEKRRLHREREEQERLQREEQERLQREEQERLQREEQERLQREEQERLQREEQERLQREEQERLQREEQERLQREEQERLQREEQERLQREEDQRTHGEELERRRTEEAAVQLLIEEKRRREEEEQRRADEERAQAQREAQLLQKQREEEQAKDKARVELLQQQRKLTAQKEEGERQARKKRLEEIMRRTRRTDPPDMTPVTVKENTQPLSSSIEEAAKVVTKPSTLEINCDDDVVPVVAFKERRSLRTLSGLDEIQSQQRAEVL
uniref:Ensconsin-like n=1 Tax=Knipowitschia caucasica TaxID=637954 RepID=A0AAV2JFL2_KNICA